MGNHDKSLEQIAGNHVIWVDIEDEAVTARPYAHLQTHVIAQVEWGLEYRRAECAERLLSENGSGDTGSQFDVSREASCTIKISERALPNLL